MLVYKLSGCRLESCSSILRVIRFFPNSVFDCDDHKGIRLITSHLREQKSKHNFQICLNPIYLDIEPISHSPLFIFDDKRHSLMSKLKKIDCKLLELTNSSLSKTLLCGNTLILNAAMEYIISTERFEELLIE